MHLDEVPTDPTLVRRLLAAQFAEWADLEVEAIAAVGTDNAIYRLGDDMCVRLPRIETAARQLEKEHAWLARLAPDLPLEIPIPLAGGKPGGGYPWAWSVWSTHGSTARTLRLPSWATSCKRRALWPDS